jgi:hypothetical protein
VPESGLRDIEKDFGHMPSSIRTRSLRPLVGALVLVAVVAVVATGAFGATPSPAPSPTLAPTPVPPVVPVPVPSVPPSTPPATDGDFDVALRDLTGHDVSVVIEDRTDSLVTAESGNPGDGMSVRWFDVKVENIDAETLRIVWVGLGRDELVHLGVSRVDDKVRLRFVQAAPPAYSDATGYDRVLNLKFDVPVRSEDVLATIQEGLDTTD